jgi:hypothetical protein
VTEYEAQFTTHLVTLTKLRHGSVLDADMLAELRSVSKQLWDADPQRGGAQAIYWWIEESARVKREPSGVPSSNLFARIARLLRGSSGAHRKLTKPEAALIAAVGFVEVSRTAASSEQRIALMQKALIEAKRAKEACVGGSDVLHMRLAHTLGPLEVSGF